VLVPPKWNEVLGTFGPSIFLKQFEESNISCEVLKYSKVRTLAMQPTPAHQ
jgi:hypothetical protein